MRRRSFAQDALGLTGVAACLLGACSVDTSDITWRPDTDFEPGDRGGIGSGGVLNKAGTKGQAGSEVVGEGGEVGSGGEGGSNMGGTGVGGKPAGGSGGTAPGGSGGGSNVVGYPCKIRVVPDRLIADFTNIPNAMSTWQNPAKTLTFGLYTYPPGNGAPMLALMNGQLNGATKVDRPSGFGVRFSTCADAKAAGFTGIRFDLSGVRGDARALVVRAGIGTNDNTSAEAVSQTGGCVPPTGQDGGYCRAAATEIMLSSDMPGLMSFFMPFDSFRMGNPTATLDTTQIISVEWGFIYLVQDGSYNASVTVDNVSFN